MKTEAEKKKSKSNKHTFIEGILYFTVAFLAAVQTDLASEESYKYMNPGFRFWVILSIGAFIAGFNALKAFRSMTFGRAYNEPDPTTTSTQSVEVTTVTPVPTNEKTPSSNP